MCDVIRPLLGAYFDDELPADQRPRVEEHLRNCTRCAAELEHFREDSRSLADYPFQDLIDRELADLHDAIDDAADRPVWRIGGALAVVAASVLIVSCAWLMELPTGTRSSSSQATVTASAPPEPWEQVATTLRADPIQQAADDRSTQLAAADMADWILEGLSRKVSR
jgi:anti-sigma factor RsiW